MAIYVITLDPDNGLKDSIISLKKQAKAIAGSQLYIDDVPHITLYLGDFEDISRFDNAFRELVNEIKESKPFMEGITVNEWVVFEDDVSTGSTTLVCGIKEHDIKELKIIQQKVVSFMEKFRKKEIIKRFRENYDRFGDIEKSNLDKYGFPYVGDIWEPHLTIASFDKQSFNKIQEKFKNKCPKGLYRLVSASIYELDESNEKISLVKTYTI